jgi:8-oxo-dGTP pyrophosphatase MutT (NUDIX family)
MSKLVSKAACVLIQNNHLYLGVSRKNNKNDWGLPGGKSEGEETLKSTAVRELFEETGLIISEDNLTEIFSRQDEEFNVVTYCLNIPFSNLNQEPKQCEDGLVNWVTQEDLIDGTFGIYNKLLFEKIYKQRLHNMKSKFGEDYVNKQISEYRIVYED